VPTTTRDRRLVLANAQCPQAVGRQVDQDQGAGRKIRQPAQALERQLQLAHPHRQRDVQRGQRGAAQHAVVGQSMALLEMGDAFGQGAAVPVFRRRRRVRRQVTQQHETLVQRPRALVTLARGQLAARRLRQRRVRQRRQLAVMRERGLGARIQRNGWLGGAHRRLQAAPGQPGAQALDRVVVLQPGIGEPDVEFGTYAADAQVGEVMQHGGSQCDVEGRAVGLRRRGLARQGLDAIVARIEAGGPGSPQHVQRGRGLRRLPCGRVMARCVETLQPAALVVGAGRHRRVRGLRGQGLDRGVRCGLRGRERQRCRRGAQGERGGQLLERLHVTWDRRR
jgi:hypothetical protein